MATAQLQPNGEGEHRLRLRCVQERSRLSLAACGSSGSTPRERPVGHAAEHQAAGSDLGHTLCLFSGSHVRSHIALLIAVRIS